MTYGEIMRHLDDFILAQQKTGREIGDYKLYVTQSQFETLQNYYRKIKGRKSFELTHYRHFKLEVL